ncbi:hypothetical protein, partial [Halopseudomonas bauzanensis]|uniref:hypothetical protein n=1 Tax=Halopseudomonas bauzanensis TaxID=653930 RepID=UPI001B7F9942
VRVQQTDFFGEWGTTFLRIQSNPLALDNPGWVSGWHCHRSKEQKRSRKTRTPLGERKLPFGLYSLQEEFSYIYPSSFFTCRDRHVPLYSLKVPLRFDCRDIALRLRSFGPPFRFSICVYGVYSLLGQQGDADAQ